MAVAGDVPGKFDVVINGKGYMYDRRPEVEAELSFTPTFLPRTNVSGAYGDNEQDYFLTTTQKDWSGGEGQVFFRDTDAQRNRFFDSDGIMIAQAGQIQIEQAVNTFAPTNALICGVGKTAKDSSAAGIIFDAASAYSIGGGSIGGANAHGAGTPSWWSATCDQHFYYLAGSTTIRKSADGVTWSGFSAQAAAGSLAFHNNVLYSFDGSVLRSYSTAGVATDIFTFKGAEGTADTGQTKRGKVISAGAKLYVYRQWGVNRPELWEYDGTDLSPVAVLPIGLGWDAVHINGVIYLSTVEVDRDILTGTLGSSAKGVIYAFSLDGSINEIWRDDHGGYSSIPSVGNAPSLTPWAHYLAFAYQNNTQSYVKLYDLKTGAVQEVDGPAMPSQASHFLFSTLSTVILGTDAGLGTQFAWEFPKTGAIQSDGTITTSLFDFDNSLTKNFRSIKIEWTGTAGQVDIYYRVGDTTGTYTLLQSPATSGTEYVLTGVTGRSISVRLVLVKSALISPVVKRIYVRTAPVLQSYRKAVYALDCSGNFKGKTPVMDRAGRPIERSGATMLTELKTALQSVSVSITDELGTYTGALDPELFTAQRIGPGQFLIKVGAREV